MDSNLRTRDALIEREKLDGAKSDRRAIAVTASTDAIDSWDEVVDQSWDLSRYEKNPIVLWQHDRCEPIGTAENVRVENGALKATLVLAPQGVSEDADKAWSLIEAGILRAVSVGFVPRDVRYEKRNGVDVAVLANNELREISIVSLPANPDAVIEARVKRAETQRQQLPVAPAKDPTKMDNILKSLGLPAGSTEQDAAAAIERVLEALGAKSAGEAHGKALGLAAKAAAHDKLAAELEAQKAAEAKRERAELIKSAQEAGKLPPGAEALRSQLESLPIESARALVEVLPVQIKTGPTVKRAPTGAHGLSASELKVAKSLGVSAEEFAAEKARREALNDNTPEEG